MSQQGLNQGRSSEFITNIKQIFLLLWKNFSLQKRSKIGTILEILVPTLFVIILLPIRRIVKSDIFLNNTVFDPFPIDSLPDGLIPQFSNINLDDETSHGLWTLAYQPNNVELVKKIMEKVSDDLDVNIIGKLNKMLKFETRFKKDFFINRFRQ